MSESLPAVVVGAGHAGLAASHALRRHAVDHVVLERGSVGNSWRTERWDSLRLLTPNWLNGLPGHPYDGPDPDGYLTTVELADRLDAYARDAPVRSGTTLTSLRSGGGGYLVDTDSGPITARSVVIASGACNRPVVPALAAALPASVAQLTGFDYRSPAQLDEGGVLVVGASATGVQLAAEIARSGRRVTLAVGEHVRMPRTYRGHDVCWWLSASGVWDERYDDVDDLTRARRLPSPQLVGTPGRDTLDLAALTDLGVELVGRLAAVRDGVALCSGGLRNVLALADLKQQRLLDGFDAWAAGHEVEAGPAERPEPTLLAGSPRLRIDLASGEIRTVVWATGYRPEYPWLDLPVVDAKGHLVHDGGVLRPPGLYALGLPVLRRRRSSFISGIEDDAAHVTDCLVEHLATAG